MKKTRKAQAGKWQVVSWTTELWCSGHLDICDSHADATRMKHALVTAGHKVTMQAVTT